eukprot:TRINITY_DN8533_c0_g1_i2.p1 TRINITY_DN8533_c0_g1~~TRINITY_DN8533_c0_g1_i2.p1  ORF type:complete len:236 (-),score=2.71 TRINITY_DN8533_c0_g1_i2:316-1023(-)
MQHCILASCVHAHARLHHQTSSTLVLLVCVGTRRMTDALLRWTAWSLVTLNSLVGATVAATACRAGCSQDPKGCPGDLCCSLNGRLQTDGSCACRKPWRGPRCETLSFLPVSLPEGYGMTPNVTSWGAHVLHDGAKYHMYVAAMTNNCSLDKWWTNSRIEHATSESITGPYKFEAVAVNTWAHNPATVRLKNGSYALFHIGDGSGPPDGGVNCTPGAAKLSMGRPVRAVSGATLK